MKCLHPTTAWICGTVVSRDGVVSPKLEFSASRAMAFYSAIGCLHLMDNNQVALECGKCINCLMRKRKDMSVRLAHEASMHDVACFLTLTYDDDHVPTTCRRPLKDTEKLFDRGLGTLPEFTLLPRDVQLFMKRLRSHLKYHEGIDGLRFFAVGEYGGRTHRPHYHILIFGWKPKDLVWFKRHRGNDVFLSKTVSDKWRYGYISVSEVSPYVAKYAARYVTKKYSRLKEGDFSFLVPEFTLQSVKNGGIGAKWFDKFGQDACCVGFCTLRCSDSRISCHRIPLYYWSRLRKRNLQLWVELRDARIDFVKRNKPTVDFDELSRIAACSELQLLKEKEMETF